MRVSSLTLAVLRSVPLERYQEVLSVVFQYLSFLRSSTFEPWRQVERCKIDELSFQFKDKESPIELATLLSGVMDWSKAASIDPHRLMRASYICDVWDDPERDE